MHFIKGQIVTLDFLSALSIVLVIYLFFLSWVANTNQTINQESQHIIQYGDVEKITLHILSFGEPYDWNIEEGIPGLLCTDYQICNSKLSLLKELCTINYTRLKNVWGLNNNFSIVMYNDSYSDCICNCGAVEKKTMTFQHISVAYNNSIHKIRIGVFSNE